MIGLVLVTHGRLAEEFISAAEHVMGKQDRIAAVCIYPDDDMEERRQDILNAIDAVSKDDQGSSSKDGVIVLTDMFGGTPSNLAISVMETDRIEVIAGVNLPMLIRLVTDRAENNAGKSLSVMEAALSAQAAGQKYINVASRLLSQKR